MIGLTLRGVDPATAVDLVAEADAASVDAVWLQAGGVAADPLTLFAAAAVRSQRIMLGTAIVPTWPRHPLVVAQQALVLESLAPGRLVLGVGPSTAGAMRAFGVDFHRPLAHLREYVTILRAALHEGSVRFEGEHLAARARLADGPGTPVMVSALQEGAFGLAGEIADGAITWVCPPDYVRSRGLPALARGAERAGRPTPPVVLHVPVCRETDAARVLEAASSALGAYTGFQFYRDMFATARHPPREDGRFSPELVDALVVYGTDEQIRERLSELAGEFEHLMLTPIAAARGDAAPAADLIRGTIRLLGEMRPHQPSALGAPSSPVTSRATRSRG